MVIPCSLLGLQEALGTLKSGCTDRISKCLVCHFSDFVAKTDDGMGRFIQVRYSMDFEKESRIGKG